MPTNLPVRRRVQDTNANPGANLRVLLWFYAGLGCAVLLIVAAEIKLGVFENRATMDIVLQSTGTDVATDEAYATRIVWNLLDSGQADDETRNHR